MKVTSISGLSVKLPDADSLWRADGEVLPFLFQLKPDQPGLSYYQVRVTSRAEAAAAPAAPVAPADPKTTGRTGEAPLANNTRVVSVEHVHEWTKAGLMIRDGLSPDARHAFVFATPSSMNGVAFQRRGIAGNATIHTSGLAVAPPVWVRLRREGDAITAFARASESEPWAPIATQTLSGLPGSVQVGLAVTSHVDDTLATAAFDGFSVTSIVPTLPPGWCSGRARSTRYEKRA